MRLRRRSAPPEGENILPMINVVFLLLIFFMIAGALERADLFDITPPEALVGRSGGPEDSLLLMAADGRLALNGASLERVDLETRLADLLEARPEAAVYLKADAHADAQEVVTLLEALRQAGVRKVVLLATDSTP